MKSGGFHVKSSRFHEILGHSPHPAFIKLNSFCWNTCFYNFGWISQVISGWTLLDFTGEILGHSPHLAFIKLKSFCWNTCFYNFGWISQVISGWNPLDFTGQICQISGWTLLDFTGEILGHSPYPAFIKLNSFCWNTCFYNLGGFHRWNLGEICQISQVKSPTLHSSNWRVFAETLAFIILGGFHRWYLGEICQISQVKSAGFHGFHEICWISRISWMWAFGWWSSIGLSIERPISECFYTLDPQVIWSDVINLST